MFWKPDPFVDEYILNFLRSDDILLPRKEQHLKYMNKGFSEFEEITEKVLSELDTFVEESPQVIIDLSRDFLRKDERLTNMYRIARQSKQEELTPIDNAELISRFFETASILKMGAYLLSGRRAPIENLSDNFNVLGHFNPLGLNKSDRENIRLIRNSSSHEMKILDGGIVFPGNGKLSIDEINNLRKKIDNISSWWFTLATTTMWYNPKFGFLCSFGIISYIIDHGDNLSRYAETVKSFFPEMIAEQEAEAQRKKKPTLKKHLQNTRRKIKSHIDRIVNKKSRVSPVYQNNFHEMNEHFIRHSEAISDELSVFYEKLEHENDKERLNKIIEWFRLGKPTFQKLIDIYNEHGEKIFDPKQTFEART